MVAISAALLASIACEGRLGHRQDDQFVQTIGAEGIREVRIDIEEGALSLAPSESGEIVVDATVRRAADTAEGLAGLLEMNLQFEVTQPESGLIVLRTPRAPEGLAPPEHRLIYRTLVRVPPSVRVSGKTGFGHVSGQDLKGHLTLATGHGDLRIDSCSGGVDVSTGGGAIMVQKHVGPLVVKAGECQTMQVFVDELSASGIHLETGVGGIQLHLPGEAKFAMDVMTKEGRARNSFGVPVEQSSEHPNGKEMKGDVAGGGPPVVIRAVKGGNVSVRARSGE